MTEFERFVKALALTETEDSEIAWGDAKEPAGRSQMMVHGVLSGAPGAQFRAMGRWQMHPDWYAQWADPAMQVGWSWDEAFRAALAKFWRVFQRRHLTPNHAAMCFHVGASAYERGDWDHRYDERFNRFWGMLGEES